MMVESLVLPAAKTEQIIIPISNCLCQNSQNKEPCTILSKPPHAVGVWRKNAYNYESQRHLLLGLSHTMLFVR